MCLVEEAGLNGSPGCIAVVEIFPDGTQTYLGPVIEESFHLSFPFPLEIDGRLFVIPESAESRTIRIYECDAFPTSWRLTHILADDVEAYDTILFPTRTHWNQHHWTMLTTLVPNGSSDCVSRLYRTHLDNPLTTRLTRGDFDLVFYSPEGGRNAGLIDTGETPLRASQIQRRDTYGAGLIVEDGNRFGVGTRVWGSHHVHSVRSGTVMDFLEV
jgi:hypothetical protein